MPVERGGVPLARGAVTRHMSLDCNTEQPAGHAVDSGRWPAQEEDDRTHAQAAVPAASRLGAD